MLKRAAISADRLIAVNIVWPMPRKCRGTKKTMLRKNGQKETTIKMRNGNFSNTWGRRVNMMASALHHRIDKHT